MTATAKKPKRLPDDIIKGAKQPGLQAVKLAPAAKRSTPERLVGITYYVTPSHKEAFFDESIRRARMGARVNASAVLREFLDDCLEDWLKRQSRG